MTSFTAGRTVSRPVLRTSLLLSHSLTVLFLCAFSSPLDSLPFLSVGPLRMLQTSIHERVAYILQPPPPSLLLHPSRRCFSRKGRSERERVREKKRDNTLFLRVRLGRRILIAILLSTTTMPPLSYANPRRRKAVTLESRARRIYVPLNKSFPFFRRRESRPSSTTFPSSSL